MQKVWICFLLIVLMTSCWTTIEEPKQENITNITEEEKAVKPTWEAIIWKENKNATLEPESFDKQSETDSSF